MARVMRFLPIGKEVFPMIRFSLFALALILAPIAAVAGLTQATLVHDGLERSYRLYSPENVAQNRALPLVIVLHGGGGSSREVIYSTRARFNALADRDGFLVLYPDAIGRVWDTGGGEISGALSPRRDDDGFLRAAIETVAHQYKVDPRRIFVTGVSRGGMEGYAFACAHPDLIRAIASVAMPLPEASADSCATGPAFGFLLIHGTADPFVPYDGGPINLGRRDRDRVTSAPATYAAFRHRNGCSGDRTTRKGSVEIHDATGCAAPTGFASVGGGGHGWPGGRKVLPGGRAGPVNADISAPDVIWDFFRQF
jgi:polyhydroxybutyrate depolymerase